MAERLKSILAMAAVVALVAAVRWPIALVCATVLVDAVLAANASFLRFLAVRGGLRLALWGAQPAHAPWPGSHAAGCRPARLRPSSRPPPPEGTPSQPFGRGQPSSGRRGPAPGSSRRRSRRTAARLEPAGPPVGCRSRWRSVVGGLLLPHYRDGVQPDGLAHIRIAQYHAEGSLGQAVNGYWGRLFFWLLRRSWCQASSRCWPPSSCSSPWAP